MRNCHEAIRIAGHDTCFEPMPVAIPCKFKKHSFEQIETLRERVDRGEELFHPEDCRLEATTQEKDDACVQIKIAGIRTQRLKPSAYVPRTKTETVCVICQSKFLQCAYRNSRLRGRKTCSRECFRALARLNRRRRNRRKRGD